MSSLKTFKPLLIFLVIIFILAGGEYLFLQNYSKANYSDEKKEKMLSSKSQFSYASESPCTNYINGDPDAGENYIKVHIHCDDKTSTNSLALKAVHPSTYAGAIQMLGKANLFESEISSEKITRLGSFKSGEKNWHCFKDNLEITDFNKSLQAKDTIDCFYN